MLKPPVPSNMSFAATLARGRLVLRLSVLRPSNRRRFATVTEPFFPNEPTKPLVSTVIPGPKARAALADIDDVFDTNNVNMVTDFERSVGN